MTGTEIIQEDHETPYRRNLIFHKGPIFAQMILADEINRTPPKTYTALLEAMQEHRVTDSPGHVPARRAVLRARHAKPDRTGRHLPAARGAKRPVHLPHQGPLPEPRGRARGHPPDDLVLQSRDSGHGWRRHPARAGNGAQGAGPGPCHGLRARPRPRHPPEGKRSHRLREADDRLGSHPRACQHFIIAAKVRAILKGRFHTTIDDIVALAHPILRHRLVPTFNAEAEGITVDDIIDHLVESTRAARRTVY
ncbi:MAG: AAA family ATPase [Verrucomicrobiales bacterium]